MMIPGTLPYVRWLRQRRLKQDYERARVIEQLGALNFDTWSQMTDLEKDQTMKQTQRAVSELAGMFVRLARYELGEMRGD